MIVVKCGFYDLRNALRYFDENFYRIITHFEATRKLLIVHNKTTKYFCQMLPFRIEISSFKFISFSFLLFDINAFKISTEFMSLLFSICHHNTFHYGKLFIKSYNPVIDSRNKKIQNE